MSHIKTADEILKELSECENPVTVSSLKTIAISKLKQERDNLVAELKRYSDAIDKCEGGSLCGCGINFNNEVT